MPSSKRASSSTVIRSALVLVFVVVPAVAGCGQAATRQSVQPVAQPTVAAVSTHAPATLLIPEIGVEAAAEPVGVDSSGNMGVPSKPEHVGWYEPGPAPGAPGDAVIDGHLNWYTGRAAFENLQKLRQGAEIDVIARDGATLRFVVTDSRTVAYTDHPAGLFATTGSPRLSLITCGGAWDKSKGTYLERLVVNAVPLSR
jgi:sortase (surface protein transpeptidase)